MGKLFEGFEILCSDYDYILEKSGETIQGEDIIQGNMVPYARHHNPLLIKKNSLKTK
jgi:hypothetical protein